MEKAKIDALEDCLKRIQSGANIEQVLDRYPQWAEELRLLLEAAVEARSLRSKAIISEKAMLSSRNLFVERAVSRGSQRQGFIGFFRNLNHALITGFVVVLIMAVATSIVSAQSIPGDFLYPVKLAGEQTRLLLTSNQESRLTLLEGYDATRASEVEHVLQDRRSIDVNFAGLLTRSENDMWKVAGVPVTFNSELAPQFNRLLGAYVVINGLAFSNGTVQVTQINLRELEIKGTVDRLEGDNLVIDGISISLDKNTQTLGTPQDGAYVIIKAYRIDNNKLLARQILVVDSGKLFVEATQTNTSAFRSEDRNIQDETTPDNIAPINQQESTESTTTSLEPLKTSTPEGSDGDQEDGHSLSGTATPTNPSVSPTSSAVMQPSPTPNHDGEHESDFHPTPTPTQTPTQSHDSGDSFSDN